MWDFFCKNGLIVKCKRNTPYEGLFYVYIPDKESISVCVDGDSIRYKNEIINTNLSKKALIANLPHLIDHICDGRKLSDFAFDSEKQFYYCTHSPEGEIIETDKFQFEYRPIGKNLYRITVTSDGKHVCLFNTKITNLNLMQYRIQFLLQLVTTYFDEVHNINTDNVLDHCELLELIKSI